ncbi:MAG TPA: hypothetical protein VK764_07955 [Terracidiphilus sp.]|jgi:hypothetical protein|nr:hypothetical protein [Terracidiphilus sp.]
MQISAFALLVCAGPLAFCQSNETFAPYVDHAGKMPFTFNSQARDFSQAPRVWNFAPTLPMTHTIVTASPALRSSVDLHIDPEIVVHPSSSRIGAQPQGTFMAQNQFPGLRFLPIDAPQARVEPVPIVWPHLNMEQIPTICRECRMVPAQSVPEKFPHP